jgi:hypothetical protein
VGVSIAERLLTEISPRGGDSGDERIRIILACRSLEKASAAVEKLRKCFPGRDILVDIEQLDLCQMSNVELFCQRFLQRYIHPTQAAS